MYPKFMILLGSPAFCIERSKTVQSIVARLEPGKNNYQINYLVIHAVYDTAIDCETVLMNEYGSVWGNEDRQITYVSLKEMVAIRRMFKTNMTK